jgi:hypothetical protein
MIPAAEMRWLWPLLHAGALGAAHHAQQGSPQMWTIAAVVVAALGTAVVAWQSWETHRSTDLGQRSLEASYSLAIDGARTRLDQDAPRIDVYVEQVSVLPSGFANGPGSQTDSGARWCLPGDATRSLRVQARVRVINLMNDRTIHLKVKGMHDQTMRADTEVLLVPAAKPLYFLTATFTLGQWAENWESQQTGKAPPHVVEGSVIAGDDRDEGVVDTWPLRLAAWPIQPAGHTGGTWQLTSVTAGNDWCDIAIRPLRERSYWISQRNNIPMPEPTYYKPQ